jgi:hypothetical protein
MPKATYWPEKPNDSVHEEDGRMYTHRDSHGRLARLINSDIWHPFEGAHVEPAKVWAVLKRRWVEDIVITTQNNSLSPLDAAPEFVKGAVNKSEGPSERWADIKVDTPMWVSTDPEADVFVALFSHAEGDTVYTFGEGESSGDNSGNLVVWKHVTVAPTECNP